MLTREDILAMPAGRELDEIVAKSLFNARTITKQSSISDKTLYALVGGENYQPLEKGKTLLTVWWRHTEEKAWEACPYYSASISAAWEVVEKMPIPFDIQKSYQEQFGDGPIGWAVNWCDNNGDCGCHEGGPCANGKMAWSLTTPEAICKAALIALMEDKPNDL